MKPNRDSVSSRLREIKENLGLSIAALAEKVDSSKSKINSYLRGVALPPNDTAEKIALLANVDKEWIYYGELKDYIRDFLVFIGHEQIINYYPQFIQELEKEYKKQFDLNTKIRNEKLLEQIFEKKYNEFFQEYLVSTIEGNNYRKKVDEYVLPKHNNLDDNWNEFLREVEFAIKRIMPNSWYMDEKKYLEIVESVFEEYKVWATTKDPNKMLYPHEPNSNNQLVDYLIGEFKSYTGTANFINTLAAVFYKKYDFESKQSEQIVEAFQELGIKLEEIMKESNKE